MIGICAICRLENRYIREYVEYYKKLDVDKIFLYDNNYDGEDDLNEVISDYIKDGFVEVINFRNKKVCQLEAYQNCYDEHSSEFDWIGFLDTDEFITIKDGRSLPQFLKDERFKNYEAIHLNWMCYGDNGLLRYDSKPVRERFAKPIMPINFMASYEFPENYHIKTIIRGGLNNIKWSATPHTPKGIELCCDADGNRCDGGSPFNKYTYNTAWIDHYVTKTLEEYVEVKLKRGYPDRPIGDFSKNIDVYKFFKYNELTKEKDVLKEHLIKKEKNVDLFICTHKDFTPHVVNDSYKILDANKIKDTVFNNGLDDKFYSELFAMVNLPRLRALNKYVGFCHYRKYFDFLDNIPDMDKIFSEYDCIVAKPITFRRLTIRQQYANCHNIEDLEIVEGIVKRKYPKFTNLMEVFLDGKIMIPYNMFVLKRGDFIEYCSFIEDILNEYLNVVGLDIKKHIEDNKEKYLKGKYPNNTVEYQYRIGGYLAERLTNIFMISKFKKMKTFNIVITEGKYKKEQPN